MYIYIHTHTGTYLYTSIYTYIHMYSHIYIWSPICIHLIMHLNMYVYVYILYVHTYKRTGIQTNIRHMYPTHRRTHAWRASGWDVGEAMDLPGKGVEYSKIPWDLVFSVRLCDSNEHSGHGCK